MKITGKNKGITLVDVVNHIVSFKQEAHARFATKEDLRKLQESMENRFAQIDDRFNRRFDRQHEDIDRILSILVKDRKTLDNHEERICFLEKAHV